MKRVSVEIQREYKLKRIVLRINLDQIHQLEQDQNFDRQLIRTKTNKVNNRADYDLLHKRIVRRRKKLAEINHWIADFYEFCRKHDLDY